MFNSSGEIKIEHRSLESDLFVIMRENKKGKKVKALYHQGGELPF